MGKGLVLCLAKSGAGREDRCCVACLVPDRASPGSSYSFGVSLSIRPEIWDSLLFAFPACGHVAHCPADLWN